MLMERTVKYDYLIRAMDAIRMRELPAGETAADPPRTEEGRRCSRNRRGRSPMSLLNRPMPPRRIAELNLIPLIDVMSVLVAFLLIYTADVEIVQNTKGVEIPQSTAETQAQQSVVVMITKDHVFVQGELVANVADIDASSDPLVEPLRRVLDRPMLLGSGGDAAR